MSLRHEIINEIQRTTNSPHTYNRNGEMNAALLHDIRDFLELDPGLMTREKICRELKKQGIIETNKQFYGKGCSIRLATDELQQLSDRLKKVAGE